MQVVVNIYYFWHSLSQIGEGKPSRQSKSWRGRFCEFFQVRVPFILSDHILQNDANMHYAINILSIPIMTRMSNCWSQSLHYPKASLNILATPFLEYGKMTILLIFMILELLHRTTPSGVDPVCKHIILIVLVNIDPNLTSILLTLEDVFN